MSILYERIVMTHEPAEETLRPFEWRVIRTDSTEKPGVTLFKTGERIAALVSENEHLRAQVHNLNLYLSYVEKELPVLMRVLREEFSGMPGYTGAGE